MESVNRKLFFTVTPVKKARDYCMDIVKAKLKPNKRTLFLIGKITDFSYFSPSVIVHVKISVTIKKRDAKKLKKSH